MEFDEVMEIPKHLLPIDSCHIFNHTHHLSPNEQNHNFCSDSLPQNLFVNSTRFSDRDSGVNSQENLSEVFPDSSLTCAGPNAGLNGPKDLDWLSLEANDQFSRDMMTDPFSLIG